jgi:hypothetical protein
VKGRDVCQVRDIFAASHRALSGREMGLSAGACVGQCGSPPYDVCESAHRIPLDRSRADADVLHELDTVSVRRYCTSRKVEITHAGEVRSEPDGLRSQLGGVLDLPRGDIAAMKRLSNDLDDRTSHIPIHVHVELPADLLPVRFGLHDLVEASRRDMAQDLEEAGSSGTDRGRDFALEVSEQVRS